MGYSNKSYLGFSEPGYTLTFDIPNNKKLKLFYKNLEMKLLNIKAKTYLTKIALCQKHISKKLTEI